MALIKPRIGNRGNRLAQECAPRKSLDCDKRLGLKRLVPAPGHVEEGLGPKGAQAYYGEMGFSACFNGI